MTTYESDPAYVALLHELRYYIVPPARVTNQPFAPIMTVSDLAAEVIFEAFPREEWEAAFQLMVTRLGNTISRRMKEGLSS